MSDYKSKLDVRVCDDMEGATNTETYREFIVNSIHYFYGEKAHIPNLDNMPEAAIENLIDDLDYLWEK